MILSVFRQTKGKICNWINQMIIKQTPKTLVQILFITVN